MEHVYLAVCELDTRFRPTSENIFLSCKPIWLMLRKGYWLSANPFCNAHHTLLLHSTETNRTFQFKTSSPPWTGSWISDLTSWLCGIWTAGNSTAGPDWRHPGSITASEQDFSLTPSLTKAKSKTCAYLNRSRGRPRGFDNPTPHVLK